MSITHLMCVYMPEREKREERRKRDKKVLESLNLYTADSSIITAISKLVAHPSRQFSQITVFGVVNLVRVNESGMPHATCSATVSSH